jgi:uncharacterized protein (TIGR02300 family)
MQKQSIALGGLPVVKTNLGIKRHCVRCSNRFYDLGKNPVACPKCKHMNDINSPFKPRRGRGKATAKPVLVEKEKPAAKVVKAKTPVKQIEGVDVEEFEDIEIAGDEEIEEIEEADEIETIEEIDDDTTEDDDVSLEEADVVGAVLVDDVDDPLILDDDEDSDKIKPKSKDDKKSAKGKVAAPVKKSKLAPKKAAKLVKKPAAKKPTAKKPVKKSKPAPKAKKKKR